MTATDGNDKVALRRVRAGASKQLKKAQKDYSNAVRSGDAAAQARAARDYNRAGEAIAKLNRTISQRQRGR